MNQHTGGRLKIWVCGVTTIISYSMSARPRVDIDFRRRKPEVHEPVLIRGSEVERVSSFKLLRVIITDDLSWVQHTVSLHRKWKSRNWDLKSQSFGRVALLSCNRVLLKTLTWSYMLTSVLRGNGTCSRGFRTGRCSARQGCGLRVQLEFRNLRPPGSGDGRIKGRLHGRRPMCRRGSRGIGCGPEDPRSLRSSGTKLEKSNITDF
ncbi:uncharacterized protein LOC134353673 [Mobula hypostoma]|uniref:uncharacterized protein LOC134353673 n=1 Tax=Mobula hypostoma TaxID=723540 RepID=UPI002FC2AA0F